MNRGEDVKILAQIGVLIAVYFLLYAIYNGILHPIPGLGDSWDYHIPIAKTLLDGRFLHPVHFSLGQWYYPGSSEALLASFIFFRIPLTLSNIVAIVVLFFCLWKLGTVFRLGYYYALLFAVSFSTLNGVLRWMNAISIDVWVAVFFTLALIVLEQPKKTIAYFIQLGVVLGMLIGSKYTALLFIFVLLLFYFRSLVRIVSFSRGLAFLIPFSLLGVFWYVRNYVYTNNPFYPLPVAGFSGKLFFTDTIWHITYRYPMQMLDAGFGEYKLWLFVVPIALGWLVYQYGMLKKFHLGAINTLFLLGLCNLFLFATFPTSEQPWIMVSSFRYSYPVFIPLFLGVFLLAQKYHKEVVLGIISIGCMVMVTSLDYYPKLTLMYIPLAFLVFYFLQKYEKKN